MLLWTAIFVLALAVNQAPAQQYKPDYAENIDNRDAWDARIVSGWKANPGQFPHMVSLRMVNRIGSVQGCGGSIMSRQWILTAAHCTATQITLVIRAGVSHLTQPEFFMETQEYYMYPTFNGAQPQVVQPNDIAVVKLPISLSYSQNLKPIRIQSSADAFRSYENLRTIASGFGRTWTNGPQTEQLLWVYLRGVSNSACANLFTTTFVTDNTICARFFNVTSQSICQGDSGGPLVHISSEGEPILIGVSSFVAREPHGCHSGLPGAFIRPGPFHSWFTQVTGIDFENLKEEDVTTTTSSTWASTTTTTSTPVPTTSTSTTTTTSTPVPTTSTSTTTTTSTPVSITSTSTTFAPSTSTTFAPSTSTTQRVTSTTNSTTLTVPVTSVTTVAPSTTTPSINITTPEPEEEDIDDPELEELLKRLEIKVKVKVRLSKYLKKKKQIT